MIVTSPGTNNEFGFDYLRDNMAFSATRGSNSEKNILQWWTRSTPSSSMRRERR